MTAETLEIVVTGTDTDVGKTHVVSLLIQGLRALGRQVWIHKPVACGGWKQGRAEDARRLAPLVSDGQDPASLCRHQWPEACAPHLAAAAAGDRVTLTRLHTEAADLRGPHDLIIEGAGGLLAPLSAERGTTLDLAQRLELPLLVVTRPHLGTLNHSALTVAAIRHAGMHCLGLVLNHHQPLADDLAVRSAEAELAAHCGTPVLGVIGYGDTGGTTASTLAAAVLAQHHTMLR